MKILFMGTTDYAVACLDAMRKAGYEAAAVCTKVDKPKNRGMKMTFSPVKEYALQAGIPVLQPETLKTKSSSSLLPPTLFITISSYLILTEVLEIRLLRQLQLRREHS